MRAPGPQSDSVLDPHGSLWYVRSRSKTSEEKSMNHSKTAAHIAAMCAALLPCAAFAAGSIEGSVDFSGKPPTAAKLHREADPFCAKKPMTNPEVLVKNGKLENVWVHVSKGAKDVPVAADAKEVEMDQKDCMYEPRMAVAQVGQKIRAKNGDPVLHNVHTYLSATTVSNKGMPNHKATP